MTAPAAPAFIDPVTNMPNLRALNRALAETPPVGALFFTHTGA